VKIEKRPAWTPHCGRESKSLAKPERHCGVKRKLRVLSKSHSRLAILDDFGLIMEGRAGEPTKTVWHIILRDKFPRREISEFCKLAEIFLCIPIGSVQSERAFAQMNLIKTDLRNRLGSAHFNVAMRARRSKHTIESPPCGSYC
jgi:hypothetical protein